MTVEEENKGQVNRLQLLQESIAKQQALKQEKPNAVTEVVLAIPEVRTPSEDVSFNLERYSELAHKVDIMYHNSLVYQNSLLRASQNLTEGLKGLADTLDELIREGVKPRC